MANYSSARARMCERIALWAAVALLAAGLEPAAAQFQPPTAQPPEKHYQAARAALMGGNMDRANLEVKLALQDNPLDAASHFMLGCLLERKGGERPGDRWVSAGVDARCNQPRCAV